MKGKRMKKGCALLAAVCLVIGSVSGLPWESAEVYAEESAEGAFSSDGQIGQDMLEKKTAEEVANAEIGQDINETPETEASVQRVSEAVTEVQGLMEALPTVEDMQAMDQEAQMEVYNQAQAAYDAYGSLPEEEKAQADASRAETLLGALNSVMTAETNAYGTVIESGQTGEVTWTVYDSTGDSTADTLVISGEGKMADYYQLGDAPWHGYRDVIKEVVLEEGISNVGNSAFLFFSKIEEIVIPVSMVSIGEEAFAHCYKLTSVSFAGCINLQSIGSSAFDACENLMSVSFAECINLQSIETYAFSRCDKLISVSFEGCTNLQGIGDSAFEVCPSLASVSFKGCINLKSIGLSAFSIWDSTFESNLTNISFEGCTSLSDIGGNAFQYCDKLTSISFEDCVNLNSIEWGAFERCTSLTTIVFGAKKAPAIAEGIFKDCNALQAIYIPKNATGYDKDNWLPYFNKGIIKTDKAVAQVKDNSGQIVGRYDSMKDAFDNAEGKTVCLLKDIDDSGDESYSIAGDMILDTNGHTFKTNKGLEGSGGSNLSTPQVTIIGNLFLSEGGVNNLNITLQNAEVTLPYLEYAVLTVDQNSTLNVIEVGVATRYSTIYVEEGAKYCNKTEGVMTVSKVYLNVQPDTSTYTLSIPASGTGGVVLKKENVETEVTVENVAFTKGDIESGSSVGVSVASDLVDGRFYLDRTSGGGRIYTTLMAGGGNLGKDTPFLRVNHLADGEMGSNQKSISFSPPQPESGTEILAGNYSGTLTFRAELK